MGRSGAARIKSLLLGGLILVLLSDKPCLAGGGDPISPLIYAGILSAYLVASTAASSTNITHKLRQKSRKAEQLDFVMNSYDPLTSEMAKGGGERIHDLYVLFECEDSNPNDDKRIALSGRESKFQETLQANLSPLVPAAYDPAALLDNIRAKLRDEPEFNDHCRWISDANQDNPGNAGQVQGGESASSGAATEIQALDLAQGFSIFTGPSFHSGTLRLSDKSTVAYSSRGNITLGIDYQWFLSRRWTWSLFFLVTTPAPVSGTLSPTLDSASFGAFGGEVRRRAGPWFLGARLGMFWADFKNQSSNGLSVRGPGFGITGGREWPSGWYLGAALDHVELTDVSQSSGDPNLTHVTGSETAIWLNAGFRWR